VPITCAGLDDVLQTMRGLPGPSLLHATRPRPTVEQRYPGAAGQAGAACADLIAGPRAGKPGSPTFFLIHARYLDAGSRHSLVRRF